METKRCTRVCLLLAACLTLSACTGMFRSYGRFNPSDEVAQSFANFQVNDDFRYYISGSNLRPNALMGLSKSHRLDPATLWREVQMTPAKMKEIVLDMNSRRLIYLLKGFELLDNNDRLIGVWYSSVEAPTLLRIQEDGTVRIDTPSRGIHDMQIGSRMVDSTP